MNDLYFFLGGTKSAKCGKCDRTLCLPNNFNFLGEIVDYRATCSICGFITTNVFHVKSLAGYEYFLDIVDSFSTRWDMNYLAPQKGQQLQEKSTKDMYSCFFCYRKTHISKIQGPSKIIRFEYTGPCVICGEDEIVAITSQNQIIEIPVIAQALLEEMPSNYRTTIDGFKTSDNNWKNGLDLV